MIEMALSPVSTRGLGLPVPFFSTVLLNMAMAHFAPGGRGEGTGRSIVPTDPVP